MMNKNLKAICFDMDGTIAATYDVPNWLPKLRSEDPSPYCDACPMWHMEKLASILRDIQKLGIEIRIITWLSKDSSEEYKEAVREAKREWLKKWDFPYDRFHGVAYGATKADSIRKYLAEDESAILIDDNAKVRQGWHLGETIDPTACDLLEVLASLL